MIVGVGCIMLGNQYKDQFPMASYLIYAGIGILIVWLLVVLFFKKKKEDDSSDEIPSLGGTKKGGKTQKKGKITDDAQERPSRSTNLGSMALGATRLSCLMLSD